MIKIAHVKEIENLNLPKEVIEVIKEVVIILDVEYGEKRNVNGENGGYILVIQDREELPKLQEIYLNINDVIPEYVDKINCSNGDIWISTLILMHNDFGILLTMPVSIAPENLIKEITN
ncbi:hypothetical protein CIW83_18135 [Tissierella sp. P1]|uniref:hypothetical protein n=1 Tax=Tissierella sp. P1 TaxID=1280483 RepID=UPI000B9FB9EE|nr:hypothetical protein [Tissierella sp. P1]OZV10845.1 hypothetical protein CIW83_18135 [Tissierella sp. P1]